MLDNYPDILTTEHVSEIFGWNLDTVARKARLEEIPCKKIGRKYFFAKCLLIEFMTKPEETISQADFDKVSKLR